NW
ncbi:flagellar hook-basal body family protein, partial [Vibrio parahaemolyticus V-223/04]